MLNMIKGCNIHSAAQLQEEYESDEFVLTANVNADKINTIVENFITMQKSPVFFILEVPASEMEEKKLRENDFSAMHKNIYYIDGLDCEKAITILKKYGELLINDGISSFGFGSHDNTAEIMVRKYNVVTLWSNVLKNYNGFFEAHNIYQTDNITTAWDTFSDIIPGESFLYECNGMNIYSLIDELQECGIYFAEQREE